VFALSGAQDFGNVLLGGETVTGYDDFGCGGDCEFVRLEEFEIVWCRELNVAGIDLIVRVLRKVATGRRRGR
jgi:hypothetical protein